MPNFGELKDQIWAEIRKGIKLSNHTDSFWDNVQGFVHAVDWKVRCCADPANTPAAVMSQLVFELSAPLVQHLEFGKAAPCA